jgi:hypothetical protein
MSQFVPVTQAEMERAQIELDHLARTANVKNGKFVCKLCKSRWETVGKPLHDPGCPNRKATTK